METGVELSLSHQTVCCGCCSADRNNDVAGTSVFRRYHHIKPRRRGATVSVCLSYACNSRRYFTCHIFLHTRRNETNYNAIVWARTHLDAARRDKIVTRGETSCA